MNNILWQLLEQLAFSSQCTAIKDAVTACHPLWMQSWQDPLLMVLWPQERHQKPFYNPHYCNGGTSGSRSKGRDSGQKASGNKNPSLQIHPFWPSLLLTHCLVIQKSLFSVLNAKKKKERKTALLYPCLYPCEEQRKGKIDLFTLYFVSNTPSFPHVLGHPGIWLMYKFGPLDLPTCFIRQIWITSYNEKLSIEFIFPSEWRSSLVFRSFK